MHTTLCIPPHWERHHYQEKKKIQTPKSNLKKSTTKNHTHAKTKLFEQKTQTNKQKTWKVGEQQLQPKKL